MAAESAGPYHTRTWLLWLLAAAPAALLTRNPFYLVLILAAAQAVDRLVETHQRRAAPAAAAGDPRRSGWRLFVRIGIAFAAIGAVFNALAAHIGDTVLLRLPDDWPIVGGPITLEGLAYGALNGFGLVTLLIVAATFSAGSDTYALLRSTPAFLYQAGVITSIGLAYVPQTLTRAQEIREAQILRGHRFRGARDVLPLAVPLLAGGLERALQLAEAMEARGYSREWPRDSGAGPSGAMRRLGGGTGAVRGLLLAGTAAIGLGGFFALFLRQSPGWGWLAMLSGALAIGLALYLLALRSRRTRYRRQLWRPRDTYVSLALLAALVLLASTWLSSPGLLAYSPYPALAWPDLHPPLVVALALLAAPAVPLATTFAAGPRRRGIEGAGDREQGAGRGTGLSRTRRDAEGEGPSGAG